MAEQNEMYQPDAETTEQINELFSDEDISGPQFRMPDEEEAVEQEAQEEEVVEEVVEEAEEEEPETAEATEVEEPVEEPEEAPEEVEPEEELSETERLMKQNEQLVQMINQLASGQPVVQAQPQQPVAPPDQQQAPGQQAPAQQEQGTDGATHVAQEPDWDKAWEGVDFGDVLDNEESFKGFMTEVVKAFYTQQQQQMHYVPQVVQQQVYQQAQQAEYMQRAHDSFYEQYPELSNVKPTVGKVVEDIALQNPGIDQEELFKKTAETTRSLLGVRPEQAERQQAKERKKPNLPGSKGTRKPQAKKSAQQIEIDELIMDDF